MEGLDTALEVEMLEITTNSISGLPPELLAQLEQSGDPLLLAIDGRPAVIVQDADAYRRLLERLERLETLDGLRRGRQDEQAGRGQSVPEVFDRLERRSPLP